jgi:endonuclease-8
MAGIGNVFKSEVLFVCGIDPFRAPDTLSDEEAGRVVRKARELMRANVIDDQRPPMTRASRRTTRSMDPAARLWVYGRCGRPCRTCGTPIEVGKQGEAARLTYWCPRCQT